MSRAINVGCAPEAGPHMPYRIDIRCDGEVDHQFERLVHLGALDVEPWSGHGVTALMPDSVTPDQVAGALGADEIVVSPAVGRDNDSVWVLTPRAIRLGSLRIIPAHLDPEPGDLRLVDSEAFGTGFHPTTAMCVEAIDEILHEISILIIFTSRNHISRYSTPQGRNAFYWLPPPEAA